MTKVSIEINADDAPAIEAILKELEKARLKHTRSFSDMTWFQKGLILSEEALESIKEINDRELDNAKIEIAQTACVCIRILSNH